MNYDRTGHAFRSEYAENSLESISTEPGKIERDYVYVTNKIWTVIENETNLKTCAFFSDNKTRLLILLKRIFQNGFLHSLLRQ